MGENTKIEWAHHTFNPWLGCTKVSPACDHCYAEAWAKRTGQSQLWSGERRRTTLSNWQQPRKWNFEAFALKTRYRVFCASIADVFDNQAPEEWRADLWTLIEETPYLDWLLLTKRPQNIRKMVVAARRRVLGADVAEEHVLWPWPNVWIGTTAENQEEADRRIPHLLAMPAAKRFVSIEPLLGEVDITEWLYGRAVPCAHCPKDIDCDCGASLRSEFAGEATIDWVIVGGESGPGARPMHPDWARSLRDQCQEAGVPFFFKQWGEWTPGENVPPEIMGKRANASWFNNEWLFDKTKMSDPEADWYDEPDLYRVGKTHAGRLLDGRTWDEVPV